jgi:5-methylcytosine-specific restriction endonuclease McrA
MLLHLFRVVHAALRESAKASRSPEWRAVEKHKVATQGTCEICGSTKRLQVHHVEPFHVEPDKELDPSNLVVLCMDTNECHFRVGHGGGQGHGWRGWNPKIREHIAEAKQGKELGLLWEEARFARVKM